MFILGISAYYHDSAAALVKNGSVIAAAQEERFTRKKHDANFPSNAIEYCIEQAGISWSQIDKVVFYDKPLLKFERLLETYLAVAPKGLRAFLMSMPIWLKEKLFLKSLLKKELRTLIQNSSVPTPSMQFTSHHQSHAASAFYPSPFEKAAVLCVDGVGEWATTSVWLGDRKSLKPLWQINFPHSLGLLYSALTYYCGFKVNSGEYKLMGLAPYGEPEFTELILKHLIDVKSDGTFRLNMEYFSFHNGLTMTNKKFNTLFGGEPRKSESPLSQKYMNLARSIQEVTELILLRLSDTIHNELKVDYLCLAGGVALNCVANGRILREGPFKDIWVQPAAGDAGGALGAALSSWYATDESERLVNSGEDSMKGAYLGKQFSSEEIKTYLDSVEACYTELDDEELVEDVARLIEQGNVVGWFSGAMEFGPRALGARSILGDPRSEKMQSQMNLKIKFRESFRPFAPAVLQEKASEWFNLGTQKSPYMLVVAPVNDDKRSVVDESIKGLDKLYQKRSEIPAVTHVDFTARVQTVDATTNPKFYKLISAFEKLTDCPILINTSFNVRGEPIVHSPEDAYRCFRRTEIDYLVLENLLLKRVEQPTLEEFGDWREEFELD